MLSRYRYVEGLTSLLGSDGRYLINYLGQIKDIMGNDIPQEIDREGFRVVAVQGWNGFRKYRIVDLMCIQYKDLRIPLESYIDVIGFVIDGNQANLEAKNIGYRFRNGKLESKLNPGYYHVPGFTGYVINQDGALKSEISGKDKVWSIQNGNEKINSLGGYRICSVIDGSGRSANMSRHRALCLVFKDYLDNADKMVVNHRNGVPGDDRLDNLEWVTRGQNNKHAYEFDLKNQHMRVLSRNVLTGEVKEHCSISECARHFGYPTDETIRFRLYRSAFSTVFGDGHQFKLKSDTRDWIIPDDPQKAIEDNLQAIPIVSRNCLTSEVCEYKSFTEAGNRTGINPSTIQWRVDRSDKSPLFGYQFKKVSDPEPFPRFTQEEYLKSLAPTKLKVTARNLLTGKEIEFESVNKACRAFKFKFDESLRTNPKLNILTETGWQIKLASAEWEHLENIEDAIYAKRDGVMARNEDTGQVLVANSCRHLGRLLNCCPQTIKKTAMTRGKLVWRGYRFRLGISNDKWPNET